MSCRPDSHDSNSPSPPSIHGREKWMVTPLVSGRRACETELAISRNALASDRLRAAAQKMPPMLPKNRVANAWKTEDPTKATQRSVPTAPDVSEREGERERGRERKTSSAGQAFANGATRLFCTIEIGQASMQTRFGVWGFNSTTFRGREATATVVARPKDESDAGRPCFCPPCALSAHVKLNPVYCLATCDFFSSTRYERPAGLQHGADT
ncbi:hypothetical protein LX36DRAFT_65984 [Colletotrichum falcatum]|nr:hypothetical protein LX36DRAFT_65984 [Colletotrichum falcatum]